MVDGISYLLAREFVAAKSVELVEFGLVWFGLENSFAAEK